MCPENLFRHGLGGDAEVLVKVLVGRAGAKPMHADENSVRADDRIPAEAHGRLDRNLDRRIADDAGADFLGLSKEKVERRHRYNAYGEALFIEKLLSRERDLDLGARGEDGRAGLAVGGRELVGARGREVGGAAIPADLRQILAGECQGARSIRTLKGELPG